MSIKSVLLNPDIAFTDSWKVPTLEEINEVIPVEFQGREDFIQFYQSSNGGVFAEGAFFYPDSFYPNINKNYVPIEISNFHYISKFDDDEESEALTSILQADLDRQGYLDWIDDILAFDLLFATNYADNDFLIDGQTGEIKYLDYEEEVILVIAPTFRDFCQNIQKIRRK